MLKVALAVAAFTLPAPGQIVPVGPFVGKMSDGFETYAPNVFVASLPILEPGVATVTCVQGTPSIQVSGVWTHVGTATPFGGAQMLGSAGGDLRIRFIAAAWKFGAYFANISGTSGATVRFLDGSGAVTVLPLDVPAGGTWHWQGWESGGPAILQVDIVSAAPTPGHIVVDDLQCTPSIGNYADCNYDGMVTVADFGCFQTRWLQGDLYADCNGSGTLTIHDFGCFQTCFVMTC